MNKLTLIVALSCLTGSAAHLKAHETEQQGAIEAMAAIAEEIDFELEEAKKSQSYIKPSANPAKPSVNVKPSANAKETIQNLEHEAQRVQSEFFEVMEQLEQKHALEKSAVEKTYLEKLKKIHAMIKELNKK